MAPSSRHNKGTMPARAASFSMVGDGHWMPHPVHPRWPPSLRRARATRDGTVPDAPGVRATGKFASLGPLAVVPSNLLAVGLLRCKVTIDDHAAARGQIAGTVAAISLGRAHEGVFALLAHDPCVLPVYQPAALPERIRIAPHLSLPPLPSSALQ